MQMLQCDKDASINSDVRCLSHWCRLKVKSYDIYEVNRYRFRSEKYKKSRANLATMNSGVLVVGVDDGTDTSLEYYDIIKYIIELRIDVILILH
jgi:hypothetical protein